MTITLRAGVLNSGIQQNGTEFLTVDTSNNATLSNNLTVTGAVSGTTGTFTGVAVTGTGALRGSYGTGGITTNFAAGDYALNANTSGTYDTAVGGSALSRNTTGGNNVAIGYNSLQSNTTGGNNVSVGFQASNLISTGASNISIGTNSLAFAVSNNNNIAIGTQALYYNTADNNTAVGYQAMQGASGTSTGANNAALGYQALYANTTGAQNTAVGMNALAQNQTNSNSTAVGYNALLNNIGNNNTAVGVSALQGTYTTSTGASNSALGVNALAANTTGASNIAIGASALAVNTTGSTNTVVGASSALLLTTGSNNQILGDTITLAAAATGRIAIGRNFTQGVDTSVIIGNGTNRISNSYTVNATWAFSSDERIKNVIGKDTLGLDFINDLEPVTFRWKPSNEVPKELTSRYAEENVQDTDLVMHGLIAQNVKAALDKAGVDTFTGWSVDEDGTQKLGITDLITPMINAIKELKAEIDALKAK